MSEYILSMSARRDLQSIRDYLSDAPVVIRERIIQQLRETFLQAARFPESGRLEPELDRPGHNRPRSLLCYPYRVFYDPQSSPRAIFAIIHGRRDPLAVVKER